MPCRKFMPGNRLRARTGGNDKGTGFPGVGCCDFLAIVHAEPGGRLPPGLDCYDNPVLQSQETRQ